MSEVISFETNAEIHTNAIEGKSKQQLCTCQLTRADRRITLALSPNCPIHQLRRDEDTPDAVHPRLVSHSEGGREQKHYYVCTRCPFTTIKWNDIEAHAFSHKHGLASPCPLCQVPQVYCSVCTFDGADTTCTGVTHDSCAVRDAVTVHRALLEGCMGGRDTRSTLCCVDCDYSSSCCGDAGAHIVSMVSHLIQMCHGLTPDVCEKCRLARFHYHAVDYDGVTTVWSVHLCLVDCRWMSKHVRSYLHTSSGNIS